jgi:hypothetical protein
VNAGKGLYLFVRNCEELLGFYLDGLSSQNQLTEQNWGQYSLFTERSSFHYVKTPFAQF